MKKENLRLLALCVMLLTTVACNQNLTREYSDVKNKLSHSGKLDVKVEVEKWKQELLKSKQIGSPCNHDHIGSIEYQKWIDDNPHQKDGLPLDDKEIKAVQSDFNSDDNEDLLLYFQGENCTGHNGGLKTYAKIVYSKGTSKSDLMTEIINTIQSEYNEMKKTNKNLKEITSSYLEETTTIDGYDNGIIGKFRLYTKDDAHCCPSYEGIYTYELKSKNMEINISDSNNQ